MSNKSIKHESPFVNSELQVARANVNSMHVESTRIVGSYKSKQVRLKKEAEKVERDAFNRVLHLNESLSELVMVKSGLLKMAEDSKLVPERILVEDIVPVTRFMRKSVMHHEVQLDVTGYIFGGAFFRNAHVPDDIFSEVSAHFHLLSVDGNLMRFSRHDEDILRVLETSNSSNSTARAVDYTLEGLHFRPLRTNIVEYEVPTSSNKVDEQRNLLANFMVELETRI